MKLLIVHIIIVPYARNGIYNLKSRCFSASFVALLSAKLAILEDDVAPNR